MAGRLAHRGVSQATHSLPSGGVLSGKDGGSAPQPWQFRQYAMVGDIDLFDLDEVASRMASAGHNAQGLDPAQLLLQAWVEQGDDALAQVNGDFAIAIANQETGEIYLARDRSGARPLYFASVGGVWAFASEYKSLLVMPDFAREVDRGSLHMLHARKVVPSGRTLFKGVHQVPAQSVVKLGTDATFSVRKYWQGGGETGSGDFATHKAKIADAFMKAVKRRTTNLDQLGISLSGGVDSIAMVAAARSANPKAQIRTFTIGDHPDDPELTVARRVAEHFDTDHHESLFSSEALTSRLRHLVWGLEDPIARTETLMTYDVCVAAQGKVEVMLRGDGADGLFGGMARHKILALADRIPVARSILKDVYTFTQSGALPESLISKALIKAYFRSKIPGPPSVVGHSEEAAPLVEQKTDGEVLNSVLWKGAEHALPMLLQKVERPHALFHMRTVSPFLDNDLVDAAHRVPSLYKNDGRRGKIIFRKALLDILPLEFTRLPKYAQRVRETLVFCDAIDAAAREINLASSLGDRGLFLKNELNALMRRPADGLWAPEHAMRIWTLILTEYWARIFLDRGGEL